MVGTLRLEFGEVTESTAVMTLPDQQPYHNHLGGPHAGAMFTLAESASGALVLINFGDLLDKVVPLAVTATIDYLAVAMGPVTATARMTRTAAEVLADLAEGQRPEFKVEIDLTANGKTTGRMTVVWTLRAQRQD
jgi:acyl-coenzyme A thioesterase PaaI-like protein